VRTDPGLRPGLAFMTLHFPDDVAVNLLTIDATDPKSGTAEFKATAIRIDTLSDDELTAHLAAKTAGNGGGNGRRAHAGESVAPGAS
jgi:predicted molibdopterin-dependent oxidoreductase YjgC